MTHPEDATSSSPSTSVVLVVDDEQPSRSGLTRMLRGMGYQGRSCRNGRQALRFLAANPGAVRLLIADLLMPGLRFKFWPLFGVQKHPWVQVPAGEIGVVIAQVGRPLPIGANVTPVYATGEQTKNVCGGLPAGFVPTRCAPWMRHEPEPPKPSTSPSRGAAARSFSSTDQRPSGKTSLKQ